MAFETLSERDFALGYADQTSYDTGASSGWVYLEADFPDVSIERDVIENNRSTGESMAAAPPDIGGASGSLSFNSRLTSQAVGFDPTAGNPTATNPLLDLLEEIMGATSVTGDYEATGIDDSLTTCDANTWTLDIGGDDPEPGYAYAVGGSPTTITAIGVIKSLSGVTATLALDTRAVPSDNDKMYPLRTFIPGTTAPTAKTFRLLGADTSHDDRHIGAMPQSFRVDMNSKGVLSATYGYTYSYVSDGGSGGLQTPTEYQRLPILVGANNSRVVVGSSLLTDYNDGTADPSGLCGITDLSIEVNLEQSMLPCHGAQEGVSNVKIIEREAVLTFTVPKVTEIETTGYPSIFHKSAQEGTALDFFLEVGTACGALFAVHIPAWRVHAEPGVGIVEGRYSYTVTGKSGLYSGDGASTGAGNTPVRFYFG